MNLKSIIAVTVAACCLCGCGKKEGEKVNAKQEEREIKVTVQAKGMERQQPGGRPQETAINNGSEIADALMAGNIAVAEGVLVTAYCPCRKCCGKDADGRTSRGRDAFKTRGVAVDPTVIPYGTVAAIPGAGQFIADDTGGAMRQDWRKRGIVHIDLRFSSHGDALAWGRRILTVKFGREEAL